jgi:hypothetical protein
MFERLKRRRALRQYFTQLPVLLRRDYGLATVNNPIRLRKLRRRLSETDSVERTSYAIAMFADQKAGLTRST